MVICLIYYLVTHTIFISRGKFNIHSRFEAIRRVFPVINVSFQAIAMTTICAKVPAHRAKHMCHRYEQTIA